MWDILFRYADAVGMIGVILILIAYYLLSVNRMSAMSMSYQWLNFWGAWLILYSLFFHWNLSSVVIEAAWILISMLGMYKVWRAGRTVEKRHYSSDNTL